MQDKDGAMKNIMNIKNKALRQLNWSSYSETTGTLKMKNQVLFLQP